MNKTERRSILNMKSFFKKRLIENTKIGNYDGILCNKRSIKLCEMQLAEAPQEEKDMFIKSGVL